MRVIRSTNGMFGSFARFGEACAVLGVTIVMVSSGRLVIIAQAHDVWVDPSVAQ